MVGINLVSITGHLTECVKGKQYRRTHSIYARNSRHTTALRIMLLAEYKKQIGKCGEYVKLPISFEKAGKPTFFISATKKDALCITNSIIRKIWKAF